MLDEVIEVTLNPTITNISTFESEQLKLIEAKFNKELSEVLNKLKANTFCLVSQKKIKVLVVQYYQALCLLQKQALVNLQGYPADHPLFYTGENLLQYLQNIENKINLRYEIYLKDARPLPINKNSNDKNSNVKIMCKLSVDQLGIILKAADDVKLIIASSLSIIFRMVVPFLATEKKTNISWDSMRKTTYVMEQRDKDVVIAILEKLISRIKEY
ncbi:hypothetical protein ABID99_004937 [Mucilaginibacter sp. OAE612]|uniref:hypothetical protein n=1 Tax=Mucilaginibacter sp. OAE612 TaxID=3156444 RepID=UPI00359D122B